ncbi:hypothetical protein FPQ18DRAFT_393361 [Pyronema domesticum]|nr:hypothetical protein FPQ18DRAFT_393361 [Pyronema domesticum]
MSLDTLPPELLLEIGDQSSIRTLAVLCRINDRLNDILTPSLYRRGAASSRPVARAVHLNQPVLLAKFLSTGAITADGRLPGDDSPQVRGRPTLLFLAIISRISLRDRDTSAAKLLLDHGADFEHMRSHHGLSALHLAVIHRDRGRQSTDAWVTLFLDYGAQVDVREIHQKTPLHYAVEMDNATAIPILLRYGRIQMLST